MAPINGNVFTTDGSNGVSPWFGSDSGVAGSVPAGSPALMRSIPDAVRPAWFGGSDPLAAIGSAFGNGTTSELGAGGIGGIAAQLASMLQGTIAKLSNALMNGSSSSTAAPATAAQLTPGPALPGRANFSDVSLSSTGDPHLAVTGTERGPGGTTTNVDSHFDSMTGHADLFSTRNFGDGFTVSTTVTAPSAKGVTTNQSAGATMNGGRDSVTMDKDGTVSVVDDGSSVALQRGGSVTLSSGETVSEAENGNVTIAETNRLGGSLSTTFAANGSGVDVTATGHDVTLGGDLITGGTTPAAPPRIYATT